MIDLILNLFQTPIVLMNQGQVCKDKASIPGRASGKGAHYPPRYLQL